MRVSLALLLVALGLAACGHDERPIVVNTPPAASAPSNTVVVPSQQRPVVVTPSE
jgi:hypothetical protein